MFSKVCLFIIIILPCPNPLAAERLSCPVNDEDIKPVMKFYKKYISSIDGDRCSMYPSCSEYAKAAFKKHGLFIGFIMTCERLVRCGRDKYYTERIIINKRKYFFDPVEANDFWWHKEK